MIKAQRMISDISKNLQNYEAFQYMIDVEYLTKQKAAQKREVVVDKSQFQVDYVDNSPQLKRKRVPLDDETKYDTFDNVMEFSFWNI